jgi:hypothetical protein
MALEVAAVLVVGGARGHPARPRYASYGAGVRLARSRPVGVEIVTEAQVASRPSKKIVNLTRFAPGTAIPPAYRVVAELAAGR